MHKLQPLLCSVLGTLCEGRAPLLAGQACVAQLVHLLEHGHAVHHFLARQLTQGVEVEMPVARVPGPRRVPAVVRCKTHRLRDS